MFGKKKITCTGGRGLLYEIIHTHVRLHVCVFGSDFLDFISRTWCKHLNIQSTVLYYLQENKTDWLYITLEVKNLLWNFSQ